MDVLAVPITCGSGDISQTSNFGFKPIRVQVFRASEDTTALSKQYLDRCSGFANQRKREDMRVNRIVAEHELRRIQGYKPKFRCYPIELNEISVKLGPAELKELRKLHGRKGATDDDVIPDGVHALVPE